MVNISELKDSIIDGSVDLSSHLTSKQVVDLRNEYLDITDMHWITTSKINLTKVMGREYMYNARTLIFTFNN
jgi:hypothetical protein